MGTSSSFINNWLQHVRNSIGSMGESVTLRTVSISFDTTSYREPSESTADSSITAFVQVLSTSDDLVKEGIFRAGDLIFWIIGDASNITTGNRLIRDSVVYEINDVITHKVASTTQVYEVRTRKV